MKYLYICKYITCQSCKVLKKSETVPGKCLNLTLDLIYQTNIVASHFSICPLRFFRASMNLETTSG